MESMFMTNDDEWKAGCGDLPWSTRTLYEKTIHISALKLTGGLKLENFMDLEPEAGVLESQQSGGSGLETAVSGISTAKSGMSAYMYNPEDDGEPLPQLEGKYLPHYQRCL